MGRELQAVIQEALQKTGALGHKMKEWAMWESRAQHNVIATSHCELCKRGVLCQTNPEGKLLHMGGTALLGECPKTKETQ